MKTNFFGKVFSVDGSYNYLRNFNASIDSIIGDFDSFPKQLKYPRNSNIYKVVEQENTDFDKALNILHQKGFKNVNVWGGSGKEQDHFLGNLSTALKYKNKLSIIFYDKYHLYFFSKKKNTFFIGKNKKVSLFPFPKITGLKTIGLSYPVDNESFEIGKKIGIRNISCEKKIHINYEKGEMLIFIERKCFPL
ncbi:thiamine diphosphokinase [Blattabacterium cuenoti]|uniref:thiamine diphosphokinase n=1 Tax=Blattabacterium cuenoti TaxID=1653831 RepID=UPI001CC22854|nr:thiamine diphosphokinase [Blattabacterium cuenoti]